MDRINPKGTALRATPHRHIFTAWDAPQPRFVEHCQRGCGHSVDYTVDWSKLGPNGEPVLSEDGKCTYLALCRDEARDQPESILPRCTLAPSEDTLATFPKLRAAYGGDTEPGDRAFRLESAPDYGLTYERFDAVFEELKGLGFAERHAALRWRLTEMGLMPDLTL